MFCSPISQNIVNRCLKAHQEGEKKGFIKGAKYGVSFSFVQSVSYVSKMTMSLCACHQPHHTMGPIQFLAPLQFFVGQQCIWFFFLPHEIFAVTSVCGAAIQLGKAAQLFCFFSNEIAAPCTGNIWYPWAYHTGLYGSCQYFSCHITGPLGCPHGICMGAVQKPCRHIGYLLLPNLLNHVWSPDSHHMGSLRSLKPFGVCKLIMYTCSKQPGLVRGVWCNWGNK